MTARFEPAPETLTDEPDADAVLAMIMPIVPVPGAVMTVAPAAIDRLPSPASPTMKRPILSSNELAPVTFAARSAGQLANVESADGAAASPPVVTVA